MGECQDWDIQHQQELETLLQAYQELFESQVGLSPTRNCDHRIQLKDKKIWVNVKPYRYPHFQKTKIEKKVEEMLKQGIIQEISTILFSATIILVRKQDGT